MIRRVAVDGSVGVNDWVMGKGRLRVEEDGFFRLRGCGVVVSVAASIVVAVDILCREQG